MMKGEMGNLHTEINTLRSDMNARLDAQNAKIDTQNAEINKLVREMADFRNHRHAPDGMPMYTKQSA